MQSWSTPEVPSLPVTGPQVSIFDTSRGAVIATSPIGEARLYVCGITPYDATHMGHAATYVAFDLLNRAWRNAGHDVHYVQNVTDIDDPLLERATKVNVDWRELALRETELFREDMAALRVLPPRDYVGAVESIPLVIELVEKLQTTGAVYQVESDLYFSVTADADFGKVSGWTREQMLEVFADRGGDPERPGKKDPLDCLLWLGEREGEPAWESPFGRGRPGWHIECAAIALEHLGTGLDVQGGGSDLIFPHHEMSAGEVQVAIPGSTFANAYAHAGMVGYNGEKMSKSKGNLVFVSAVRRSDIDPMAIRMTLLRQHYRSDWEWTDALLGDSSETLDEWRLTISTPAGAPAGPVVDSVLAALADDLDAPRALSAIGDWMQATRAGDTSDPEASASICAVLDAALGLKL